MAAIIETSQWIEQFLLFKLIACENSEMGACDL
jgi:hypothetical protein